MASVRIILLTTLAMIAFAANSLFCRLALKYTDIDAASFTSIRLMSGAMMLVSLVYFRHKKPVKGGNWLSALALFVYASGFSFAYVSLPAASGALLLFGAVQATMIGYGIWQGERLSKQQLSGLLFAVGGIIALLLPGLSTPPLQASLLMMGAGMAWGIYSLLGKSVVEPIQATAGNFLRTIPLTIGLSVFMSREITLDNVGIIYAIGSGALASGVGYVLWYSVLPQLQATHAATVQLSVPVIAAIGGIAFLGEALTLRLALASFAILGGIGLVLHKHLLDGR